jgi:hypothetical protein
MPCSLVRMKRFLLVLFFGFALAAPSSTSFKSGVFFALAGSDALLRFDFKFEPNLLFNRAGSSSLVLETPWSKKPVELVLDKGVPFKDLPDEYLVGLDSVVAALRVPVGTKAGVYPIKLSAEVFLCDNLIKVCFIDKASGVFEVRVGSGKDVPVSVLFSRPNR